MVRTKHGLGIAALESIRCRSALAAALRRIVPAGTSSSGRMLAIGGGLPRLMHDTESREIVWLCATPPQDIGLPERVRIEPWPDMPMLPFGDRSFGCVVVYDELTLMQRQVRETVVREACRVAEDAVVVVAPFQGDEVCEAIRQINRLHRQTRGKDHPRLARQMECGLPDLEATWRQLAGHFPHLDATALGSVSRWRSTATLAILAGEEDDADLGLEPLVESVFGGMDDNGLPAFRHVLTASRLPLREPPAGSNGRSSNGHTTNGHAGDDLLSCLTYVRGARMERALGDVVRYLRSELSRFAETLRREADEQSACARAEKEAMQAEHERIVADLTGELRDAEQTIGRMAAEIEELKAERANLTAAVEEARGLLQPVQSAVEAERSRVGELARHVTDLQHVIAVMEATLGWKMLVVFRGIRERLFPRRKRSS